MHFRWEIRCDRTVILFLTTISFLLLPVIANGQVAPGQPSFSAFDRHEVDTVNLQNLNVELNVPVMSKSGAIPFNFSLTGNASYMSVSYGAFYPGIFLTPLTSATNGTIGWGTSFVSSTTATQVTCPPAYGHGPAIEYSGYYLKFADGTVHRLPATDVIYWGGTGGTCSSSFTDQVTDGSGWTLVANSDGTTDSVYDRRGMTLSLPSQSNSNQTLTDSNANYIQWNGAAESFRDTLGLTALTQSLGNTSNSYTWTSQTGSPAVGVSFTSYPFRTVFGCTSPTDYYSGGGYLPTGISFPDTTTLALAYEITPGYPGETTGRLSQITLRTGGTVNYNWNPGSSANNGINCTYQIPNKMTRTTRRRNHYLFVGRDQRR